MPNKILNRNLHEFPMVKNFLCNDWNSSHFFLNIETIFLNVSNILYHYMIDDGKRAFSKMKNHQWNSLTNLMLYDVNFPCFYFIHFFFACVSHFMCTSCSMLTLFSIQSINTLLYCTVCQNQCTCCQLHILEVIDSQTKKRVRKIDKIKIVRIVFTELTSIQKYKYNRISCEHT